MTLWAKHNAGSEWHRVVRVVGGSVLTRCNGRWSAEDEYREDTNPPVLDRCRACLRSVVHAPSVSLDWDMSDVDEGGEG